MPTQSPSRFRTLLVLAATVAAALGSASSAYAFGAGTVDVSGARGANGWIVSSSATVTVAFDVDGSAPVKFSGAYSEYINKIECSGPGVTGGNYDGPATAGQSGRVTTTFDVSGDSPSPAGSGVGCTATYERVNFSQCSIFGCVSTLINPAGTLGNGANVKIDSSPPEDVFGHPVTAPAADNWHNVPTVVHFQGKDANSGIGSCTVGVPIGGPSSKAQKFVSGTCTNQAGLARSGAYAYRFDDTPPTLAPAVSQEKVVLGSDVTAKPNASDLHSGVASSACDTPDTSTVGIHTVHCTATDAATNRASADATYEVLPAPVIDPPADDVPVPHPAEATGESGPEPQQQTPQDQSPPAPLLTGSLGAIKGAQIKKSQLKKGYPLQVTCTADSTAVATLTVTSSAAKKLKLMVRKGQQTVTIGAAKGLCKATGGGKLSLKLASPVRSKVLKSKRSIAAKLGLEYTKPGAAPFKTSRSLKLS